MGIIKLASDFIKPQPKLVDFSLYQGQFSLGVPRQTSPDEHRVALSPEDVKYLTDDGYLVYLEEEAGLAAGYSDIDYSEAGAQIVYNHTEIFKADIILAVAPLSIEEIKLLSPNQIIISTLNFYMQTAEYFKILLSKNITAIAYDFVRNESGAYSVIHSISRICGEIIALKACQFYADKHGVLLGNTMAEKPSEITFLGAGMVVESAARLFLDLGADIKVFDDSPTRLKNLQDKLNGKLFTSVMNLDTLSEAVINSDVLITAIFSKTGRSPLLINEDHVRKMKKGALIMDICIDQGGCVETSKPTTHSNPFFELHGVYHYAVPNITSAVSKTSSKVFGHYNFSWLKQLCELGSLEKLIKKDTEIRNGIYVYKGYLLNSKIAKKLKHPIDDWDQILNSDLLL